MTRDEMLRSEVARRLAGVGSPADPESVTATIKSLREDAAAILAQLAYQFLGCANTDCHCLVAALVYTDAAQRVQGDV